MKKLGFLLLVCFIFAACKNGKHTPDISGVKANLAAERFDVDFFSLDTVQLEGGMNRLQQKYPGVLPIFLQNIIRVTGSEGIRGFIGMYKPIFDSAQKTYANIEPVRAELEKAFRYVKYYFPTYQTPARLVTVLGPFGSREDLARMPNGDLTPNFIGPGFVGISLQFYLGKDFSVYNNEYFINNIAPLYRSRRFSREYIAADVMKLVTDDLFPDKSAARPLIEQMIEKGKQWWLLDRFMPETPDSIKTGYTQQQLNWCRDNEGLIWTEILKQENLYSIDPVTIQTYIGEGPFTQGFSQESSPGNIGTWIGRQIVQKFAEKHEEMTPEQVMKTAAKQILEEAKYKPK